MHGISALQPRSCSSWRTSHAPSATGRNVEPENVQVPTELQRASGCRHLTLTLASHMLARTYGSREELPHSPLLSMPRLRSLALLQATWDSPDVEAVLDLRQVQGQAASRLLHPTCCISLAVHGKQPR